MVLSLREKRARVVDHERRARANDLLAGRHSIPFQARPGFVHRRGADKRLLDEEPGDFFPETNRAADHVKRADRALQGADQYVVEVERSGNAVGDLVDGLEFPNQAAIVQIHLAPFECALDRREELIRIEGLLYECKGRELVGMNGRGERATAGQDDDLRLGRLLLDTPDYIEA